MPKAQFTLELSLRPNGIGEQSLHMAIDLDHELRISSRAVDEAKIGFADFGSVVTMMKTKEFRRRLFVETAMRLAEQMADRMEDAEGWHDPSRIEPARQQLGGKWER